MTDYSELDYAAYKLLPDSLYRIYELRWHDNLTYSAIAERTHKSFFAVMRLCDRIEAQLDDYKQYGFQRYGHTLQKGREAYFEEDPVQKEVLDRRMG